MNAEEYKKKSMLDDARAAAVRFHRMIAHLYDSDLNGQRLETFKQMQSLYDAKLYAVMEVLGVSSMNEIIEEGRQAFYMEKARMVRH